LKVKTYTKMSRENIKFSNKTENSKTIEQIILEMNQTGTQKMVGEYDEIINKDPMGTFNSAMMTENIKKNRYANNGLLSFDHSRVILSRDEKNSSNYINANYVDGYKQRNAFISTQG
jgi:tyrosine-protein phosphatase non-receptor type 9